MPRFRKSFVFPRSVTLHAATNRLEAAQQRWIQEHTDQLRALVRLSNHSGLEIVAFDERATSAMLREGNDRRIESRLRTAESRLNAEKKP